MRYLADEPEPPQVENAEEAVIASLDAAFELEREILRTLYGELEPESADRIWALVERCVEARRACYTIALGRMKAWKWLYYRLYRVHYGGHVEERHTAESRRPGVDGNVYDIRDILDRRRR